MNVPDDVIEYYSYGACMWLALALHERFGWEIEAQIQPDPTAGDEYIAHAYVIHPSGMELDILGLQRDVDFFGDENAYVTGFDGASLLKFLKYSSEDPEVEEERQRANDAIDRYLLPHIAVDS